MDLKTRMDLKTKMAELARIEPSTPVVSVYLNTHWRDEHQRDRVRIFLKNALAQAREARTPGLSESDLSWVEAEGDAVVFTFAPVHRGLRAQLEGRRAWLEQLAHATSGRKIAIVTREGAPMPAPPMRPRPPPSGGVAGCCAASATLSAQKQTKESPTLKDRATAAHATTQTIT